MSEYVRGVEELRRTAATLREISKAGLQKEVGKAIREATGELGEEVRRNLEFYMPSGYTPVLASYLHFVTKAKTSGWPAVTVTAKAKARSDLYRQDKGILRHPVFGRYRFVKRKHGKSFDVVRKENPWVNQAIPPGFFTNPANRVKEDVRGEVIKAIERVKDQIAGA